MCIVLKYGVWNVSKPEVSSVNALVAAGFSPLTAMTLSARGLSSPEQARSYLNCDASLPDPFLMKDMDLAVARIRRAIANKEKIAVFGDYDVDGITATCLLTDFLRRKGCNCVSYIPGRLEEGYGLNPIAIRQLREENVSLIITVDCGITAVEEARLCHKFGIDLVITDHHECKDLLPLAVAVVDPHRPDCRYPHKNLSGVGVAFKLACALHGDQETILREYADMVCLGTVADVMLLHGENRVFVIRGLQQMQTRPRPGLAALMKECGCAQETVSASSIGFMLAPRINAAGRMGNIQWAIDLFLTKDPAQAQLLAKDLCDLNRQRQLVESQIYQEAISMLPEGQTPEAIVLADESWHQGVVGIVASRMAEEFCCPTFLICLDGDHGKASSRSYGGFNLFASLTALSHLLESYGGHELAAGFTISRDRIGDFRQEICRLASAFYNDDSPRTVIHVDCAITADLLTVKSIESLNALEPCGNGCPKPVFMMENLTVDRITMVGNGQHMRLRLRSQQHSLQAISFSTTPESASIALGDVVDVAFTPQINEFRGERSVQMNILDIRPHCCAACDTGTAAYTALRKNCLTALDAQALLPDRNMLSTVWRYLSSMESPIQEDPICLCRKIVRRSGSPMSLGQLLTCLDIFQDVRLLRRHRKHKYIAIELTPSPDKADLALSITMQTLLNAKES